MRAKQNRRSMVQWTVNACDTYGPPPAVQFREQLCHDQTESSEAWKSRGSTKPCDFSVFYDSETNIGIQVYFSYSVY